MLVGAVGPQGLDDVAGALQHLRRGCGRQRWSASRPATVAFSVNTAMCCEPPHSPVPGQRWCVVTRAGAPGARPGCRLLRAPVAM